MSVPSFVVGAISVYVERRNSISAFFAGQSRSLCTLFAIKDTFLKVHFQGEPQLHTVKKNLDYNNKCTPQRDNIDYSHTPPRSALIRVSCLALLPFGRPTRRVLRFEWYLFV